MRLLSCLLLAALTIGCDDDDDGGGDDPVIDAAPDFDGDDEVIDGGVDAGPTSLTVVVRSEFFGDLVAGATVLVLDGSGDVARTSTTGADGTAIVEVAGGDSVVVLRVEEGKGNSYFGTHFVGVEAGDVLRVGQPRALEEVGELVVNTPSFDGAAGYFLQSGCGEAAIGEGEGELSLATTLYESCHAGRTTTPALLIAETTGNALAYQVATAHPFAGPLAGGPWRTDFLPMDGLLVGFSSASEFVDLQLFLFAEDGEDFALDPIPLAFGGVPQLLVRWNVPQDLASHWLLRARIGDELSSAVRTVDRLAAWPVADVELAYPADFLPRVTAIEVSGSSLDTQVGYQVDTRGGQSADAAQFSLRFGDSNLAWTLVHPSSATTASLPVLPVEYADFMPSPKELPTRAGVALFDVDLAAGYDLLRGALGSLSEGNDFTAARAIFADLDGAPSATLRSSTLAEDLFEL